jgi:Bacterial transcriptional activator domain
VALDRPAEAVALYERCRRVLGAQLGIEPSASTRAIVTSLGQATSDRTTAN